MSRVACGGGDPSVRPAPASPVRGHVTTRGCAGAPRRRHGVYKKWSGRRAASPPRVSGPSPVPRPALDPPKRGRGRPRRRLRSPPCSELLFPSNATLDSACTHSAIAAFCAHLDAREDALPGNGPGVLEYSPTSSPADWDYDDVPCVEECAEECDEILTFFDAAMETGAQRSAFQLTRLPLEPPSVAITRMEEGATRPSPPRAPTPPTPPTRRTTRLVPFETLARWRSTLAPPTSMPPDSPLSALSLLSSLSSPPTSPAARLPPALPKAGVRSTYIHDVAAAARRGAFKGLVPFHSIADRQQMIRLGECFWCPEAASVA